MAAYAPALLSFLRFNRAFSVAVFRALLHGSQRLPPFPPTMYVPSQLGSVHGLR